MRVGRFTKYLVVFIASLCAIWLSSCGRSAIQGLFDASTTEDGGEDAGLFDASTTEDGGEDAGLFDASTEDSGEDAGGDQDDNWRFIEIYAGSIGLSFPLGTNDGLIELPLLNNATVEFPGQLIFLQNTHESLQTATTVVVEFSGVNYAATKLHVYPYPPNPPYYCNWPNPVLTRPSMVGTASDLVTICPYLLYEAYADPVAVRIDHLRPPSPTSVPRIIDNIPSVSGPGSFWEGFGVVGGASVEFEIDFWVSTVSGDQESGFVTEIRGFEVNNDGVILIPSPLDNAMIMGPSLTLAVVPRGSGRAGLFVGTDMLDNAEQSLSYFSPEALDTSDLPEVIPFSIWDYLHEGQFGMRSIESCGGDKGSPPRFLIFGTGKIQYPSTIGSNAGLAIVDIDNFNTASTTWLPTPISIDVAASSLACGDYDDDGIRDIAVGVFSSELGTLPEGAFEGAYVLWGNDQGEFETSISTFLEHPVWEDQDGEPRGFITYVAGGPLLSPDRDDLVVVSARGGTIRIYSSSPTREW